MQIRSKESNHVQKIKDKLSNKLESQEKKMSEDALQRVSNSIRKQLNRHEKERIKLSSLNVTPFDENRHPAEVKSKFIEKLMQKLKDKSLSTNSKKLKGRITSELG